MDNQITSPAKPYRILSLDGGVAKGFYSLGILRGLEANYINLAHPGK